MRLGVPSRSAVSGAAERVLVLAPTTLLPHWAKEFETCGLRSGKTLFKY